jgi:2-polyprenyl-3-methyl-5-hydroxy-6-metoxy-1,4-benzoquinol methylase
MAFEQDYFNNRKYTLKQQLVERHVLEVLRWASKQTNIDLLSGKGKSAMDVGCAFGYTSKVLSHLGYETLGTDISNWGIKQAKTQSEAQFLVCDAQINLPFKAETFDLVTCFDVLEHLAHPEAALAGMFAVCRGILVCTTPNKQVEKPIRKLTRDYDETHISVKSEMEWQAVAENLGGGEVKLASFFDCPLRFGGKLFYKSFRIPKYGLTVRMAIKK